MTDAPKLTLYNTLTRTKEPFAPIDPENVRMYVCGPTVYDYAHIGNARPAIVFDVLFRLLRHLYGEDHVTYVRNITDVDDKINARALRDHPDLPLNEAIRAVTEKTLNQYQEDVAALGCLKPTFQPRATEHIDGMIAMIETLIASGNAYVATGSEGREVLFDVTSMPSYGKLSNRKLDEQQAGARIAVEAHKKNPADFVLWKESSEKEPGWPATFDGTPIYGRPGWHLECSVMSDKLLWENLQEAGKLSEAGLARPHMFDIHGGGLDLIFPHHENEIAQSVCAHGTDKMANVWMHNGFLQVEGKKMSKSEGNFFTIHELMHTEKFGGRKWPGEVLRLAMLMTHYREPIDFSVKRLEEAERIYHRWADLALGTNTAGYSPMLPEGSPLVDDLNTPLFINQLQGLYKEANAGDGDAQIAFRLGMNLLGFDEIEYAAKALLGIGVSDELRSEIGIKVDERLALIRDKNWAEADQIRDELLAQGIQLKDGKDPETGERVTTWEVKR
ncbi:cysteine--tRNA ligase [Oricola cellulosilytica]|uniref:Cysteine--tRNA ligase n=1 Tax=Oricola cellulosilytica TaxID=1429082 RepID=A0A4R0PCL5_9HYPH|nr:cysteine--tRNA ligase [Oricola cellulosilytica]TCD14273.1 cysteine--tRNA ligase [Oricola cellulosilytica]